jgi:hypothetical protein
VSGEPFSTTPAEADLVPALSALDLVATTGGDYDPARLLHAVEMLYALGDRGAGRVLEIYGREADLGPTRSGGQLDGRRAMLAARVLYEPRPGHAAQPPPALGKPDIGLATDPALCPHWPLVLSCDIPFLPIGSWFLGGAPASAARYVVEARRIGRLRARPPTPTCGPVEAADGLVGSPAWVAITPNHQETYARSLVYRQALRARTPAIPVGDGQLAELAMAPAADLDATWRRLAGGQDQRTLRWDSASGTFVAHT